MEFEWDTSKALSNQRKHGVDFREAGTVFEDQLAVTYDDPDHSVGERRFITLGRASSGRVLFVAHLEVAEDRIRILSARPATRREIHGYSETP